MGRILFKTDSRKSDLGFMGALDVQLNAAIVDIFYLACLQKQYGNGDLKEQYVYHYGFETEKIEFSNPFDWFGMLRNVTKDVTEAVLNRTIFFQVELRKRTAEANGVEQNVVRQKLDNLQVAYNLRKQILDGSMPEDEATRLIAKLLNDQNAAISSDSKSKYLSAF